MGKTRTVKPTASGSGGGTGPSAKLEELAARQGVKAVNTFEELESLWPEEFDPDAFAEHVIKERHKHRKLAQERGSRR